jgi:hypothetical protein
MLPRPDMYWASVTVSLRLKMSEREAHFSASPISSRDYCKFAAKGLIFWNVYTSPPSPLLYKYIYEYKRRHFFALHNAYILIRSWEYNHSDRNFCDSQRGTLMFYNSSNFMEHSSFPEAESCSFVQAISVLLRNLKMHWRVIVPVKKRKCISVFRRVRQWVLS